MFECETKRSLEVVMMMKAVLGGADSLEAGGGQIRRLMSLCQPFAAIRHRAFANRKEVRDAGVLRQQR